MELYVQKKNMNERKEALSFFQLKKLKLNVAAYARVSTMDDSMQKSFKTQTSYFYNMINSNPNWNYAGIYTDEGISGSTVKHRKGFIKMIEDAINGKIDLILTKSISRFARNTMDTLKWIKLLREHNVGVFFQEENIYTLSRIGDFVITVLASVAQQECENISLNTRLGLKNRKEKGVVTNSCACLGYNYSEKTKKMTINKKEKEIVEDIFDLFLKDYSYEKISKTIKSKYNRKISPTSIKDYLTNEKYIGNVLLGKKYVVNPMTHKKKVNRGERDQYLFINHHEALIDQETFEEVQRRVKEREEFYKKRQANKPQYEPYIFKGKCVCGYCGYPIERHIRENVNSLACSNDNYPSIGCLDSKQIEEKLVKEVFIEITKRLKKSLDKIDESNPLQKLFYTKKVLLSHSYKEEFDLDFFKDLVNYVIIGNNEVKDKYGPFCLRFILNTKKKILDNDYLKRKELLTYKYNKILEFEYKTLFYHYSKGKKATRVVIDKIPVSVEFNKEEVVYDN